MAKAFQSLPRLVQFILLLIPGVNWVTEIIVRVSAILERFSIRNLIGLILAIALTLTMISVTQLTPGISNNMN